MDNYRYQTPVVVNDRAGEKVTETNIRIDDIKSQLAEMEIKISALYSVIVEQGIDPKLIDKKIEELVANRPERSAVSVLTRSRVCPDCGKKVKPSSGDPLMGTCLFCGTKVPFYPTF